MRGQARGLGRPPVDCVHYQGVVMNHIRRQRSARLARHVAVVSTALLATGVVATAAHAAEPASAFSSSPLKCAQANARVNEIQIMGSTAYLGGSFTQLTGPNGQTYPRAGAAAINTSTCEVLTWNPSVVGEVFAIAPTSNAVYLG